MSGWLYRLMHRKEIREQQERGAAIAEVWRERQVENDRYQAEWDEWWAAKRAWLKTIPADQALAWFENLHADAPARPAHWIR